MDILCHLQEKQLGMQVSTVDTNSGRDFKKTGIDY
jgi:hypothetical protein